MTSDRHLNLMALMREIDQPTKAFNRNVRLAAALSSDTPQWDAAVEKGNAALDDIERALRRWVAAHPEQDEMAASLRRDGFGDDEIADILSTPTAAPAAVETGE